MKNINFGRSGLIVSQIVLGCMRITELEKNKTAEYLDKCLGLGINFFDHADIYSAGECEKRFGTAIKELKINREDIFIQSKCGIRPDKGMYDFSKDYIISSVDGILKRLDTEYLDVLVLHRPDALVEPEEVASAFAELYNKGKVRHFGVSNHKTMQIELLSKYLGRRIETNQMQLSLAYANMISNGIEVNMTTQNSPDRDGSILDYCRLNDITIQAWSPFQADFHSGKGIFIDNPNYSVLNEELEKIAEKYSVSKTCIATAWILRHPAKIQLIAGTMNQDRIAQIAKATEISLEREEWYALYRAAGNILP
jgi:predicted oxidoreductase